MTTYETKKEALKNKTGEETIRKVEGGWAVMTWSEYHIWRQQK